MPLRHLRFPTHTAIIELRHWLVPVCLLGVGAWYVVMPTAVGVMALAALGGSVILGWLWAHALARGLTAARQLHYAALQVGDELEENFSLTNTSRLPVLWAEIADHSTVPGYSAQSVRALDGHALLEWHVRARCQQRGEFTLGPWEIEAGDPFGLFSVRLHYPQQQTVLIYPPLATYPETIWQPRTLWGQHRPLRHPLPSETTIATSTRPYQPGDALHRLHWPTTARRDALYTKLFQPEAALNLWLILDFDASAHIGTGPDSTEEVMVMLAASLAARALRNRQAVGVLAWPANAPCVVTPRTGTPHLWEILRALAPLRRTPRPLTDTLARAATLFAPHDQIILLTPAPPVEWPAAAQMLNHRNRLSAIVFDPASFGGTGDGETHRAALTALGVNTQVIRREDVRPVEGAYGPLRRWEFTTFGTGKAVLRQTPRAVMPASGSV